jgi:hypothetical protein
MRNIAIIAALVMFSLTACNKKPAEEPFVPDPVIPSSGSLPTGHPAINNQASPLADMPGAFQSQKGTVVSIINIPQFTYLEVKQNGQSRWIASSTVTAKKGDTIEFDSGSTVVNFNSKTLNRTFPSLTFVNHVTVLDGK